MFKIEKGFEVSLARWVVIGRHTHMAESKLELAGVRC